jgi:hypothetical protein
MITSYRKLGSLAALMAVLAPSVHALQDTTSFYFTRTSTFTRSFGSIRAITTPVFVRQVGGVAFGGVAKGKGGLKVTGLRYDPSATDGNRLQVSLSDGSTVRASIRDWQLRPIAEFVNSNQIAAFSLFGKLQAPKNAAERQEFDRLNSDLKSRWNDVRKGLSSAQRAEADRLLKERAGTDLEKSSVLLSLLGGRALMYHPALENTLMGIRMYQADSLLIDPVACSDITIDRTTYRMEGEPQVEKSSAMLAQLTIIGKTRDLDPPFDSYVVTDYTSSVQFSKSEGRLVLSGDPYWHCWRAGKGDAVIAMPSISKRISAQVRDLGGINPAVYSALKNMMRFSGLFRAYKNSNKRDYSRFVASLSRIPKNRLENGSVIRTPTVTLPNE